MVNKFKQTVEHLIEQKRCTDGVTCYICPFYLHNNGHDKYCGNLGLSGDNLVDSCRKYLDGRIVFHDGKLVEVAEDGKVVCSVEEIEEMLDKGESITDIILDPSLTDLSFLFSDREDFNQDISNWDVSNVTDMSYMFDGAKSFNQDISKWDVSNVINMINMFRHATSFNQDISNWDVSNVEDMRGMLNGAESFNQDVSKWDVSRVKDMRYMFWGAKSFNQDLSSWDVLNVKDIYCMFVYSGYEHQYPKGY